MGSCFGKRSHQRMNDDDYDDASCHDTTSLAEPRKSWSFIPSWLKRRPKFTTLSNNPYSNLGQEDRGDREHNWNPVVDTRELWPHESPDMWAIPAEEHQQLTSNNNISITSKGPPSDSHSSLDLEWETDEAIAKAAAERRQSTEHHERMSLSSMASHRSQHSSASNDLEWDEDFADAYTFNSLKVDFDTEQLIAEIDKMTEKALRETEHEDTSLPPFESLDSMTSI